jgi:hypothetical protein
MAKTPHLNAYPFTVVLGDPENPEIHEVIAYGRDMQKVESLFADRRWGAVSDRPITGAVAAAYFACMRSGVYAGTFDQFEAAHLEVQGGEPIKVFPTDRAPLPV